MRPLPHAVHAATLALLVNMCLGLFGGPAWLIGSMFVSGPVLLLWMVWCVLKDDSIRMRDLRQGEHWGYQDRPDIAPNDP